MDGNFRVGQWLVQPQLNLIQGPGGDTAVEPKAMEVLVCLANQAREVVLKERLMQTVWADTFVTDEVLTNSIWELRKAFQDDAKNPKVIQTVFKKGYRLIAPVSFERGNEKTDAGHEARLVDVPQEAPARTVSARKWILLAIVFTLVVAAAIGVRLMRQAPSVPATKLRIVPLTSFPGNEVQPTLAPDGNQVAFVWNGAENGDNYDIYVKVIGSEKLLRLTTHPAKDISPAWSPDGRQIAFIRQSDNRRTVIFIAALGGSERILYTAQERTENAPGSLGTNQSLAWSPDGKLVALTESPIESKESRIVLISPDTDEKRTLLSSSLASVYQYANPRFSPDGRALAFVWAANPGISDVYTIAVVGGEPKRLTFANSHVFGLDFTADGRDIIFSRGSLWRIPVSGGQPERLAGIESDALSPALARRGNSLAYSYSRRDYGNIWKLDLSRSPAALEQMRISSTRGDGNAQFSPDGRRIAFASGRSGSVEIWISDADGSNPRQVTSPDNEIAGPPSWSPDAESIVFNSNVEGNHNIYTMSKEGGPTKKLTEETSQEVLPSWSRDGRWIYFGSNRSGAWQIWKISPGGDNAIQVTKHGGRQAVESIDGKFVYYTKAVDIAGLWRVPANGGGEELLIHDQSVHGYWATLDEGIYFLTRSPVPTVKLYSFTTKQTTQLAVVGKEIPWWYPGFSVSPDGKQIIYSQIDRVENDLMLVENLR